MYTNVSNSENTIKKMYSSLDSDNYIIDKILFYSSIEDNVVEFGNILDPYRDYFDTFLIDVDVPDELFFQPAAFAEKYYGTPDLDFLVLYFARMTSLYDFKKSKIKILPKGRILEINRLFTKYKDAVSGSYKNPSKIIEQEII